MMIKIMRQFALENFSDTLKYSIRMEYLTKRKERGIDAGLQAMSAIAGR